MTVFPKEIPQSFALTAWDVATHFGCAQFSFEDWRAQFRRGSVPDDACADRRLVIFTRDKRAWERLKHMLRLYAIPHQRIAETDEAGNRRVDIRFDSTAVAFLEDKLPPLEIDEDLGDVYLELAAELERVYELHPETPEGWCSRCMCFPGTCKRTDTDFGHDPAHPTHVRCREVA